MKFSKVLVLLLLACKPAICQSDGPLIWLQNESLRAGILTEVGGRLVSFGSREGPNLLKFDSSLWNEPDSERIIPSPYSKMKSYFGHIIWPGPQSEWWLHQDLNVERRDARALWPPDPYLIYSSYKILEQSKSSITLEGPPSPVSGVKLTKKYTLSKSGMEVEVRMTNTSESPVSWDIWSNTRFDGSTHFFVPACEKGLMRISVDESGKTEGLKGEIVEGAFTFVNEPPGPGQKSRYAKAFLHPEEGKIVALARGIMLVMSFDYVEPQEVHPEQGFIEIYKRVTASGRGDLLELEHHSAYLTLQPGESHELRESWDLHEYSGELDMEEAVKWYNFMNQ